MVSSDYSAVGKLEDWYSGGRGIEPVAGTIPCVDMKVSNQHPVACCSRAVLATRVAYCSCVCLGDEKC